MSLPAVSPLTDLLDQFARDRSAYEAALAEQRQTWERQRTEMSALVARVESDLQSNVARHQGELNAWKTDSTTALKQFREQANAHVERIRISTETITQAGENLRRLQEATTSQVTAFRADLAAQQQLTSALQGTIALVQGQGGDQLRRLDQVQGDFGQLVVKTDEALKATRTGLEAAIDVHLTAITARLQHLEAQGGQIRLLWAGIAASTLLGLLAGHFWR